MNNLLKYQDKLMELTKDEKQEQAKLAYESLLEIDLDYSLAKDKLRQLREDDDVSYC